jgi:hypothetical protein
MHMHRPVTMYASTKVAGQSGPVAGRTHLNCSFAAGCCLRLLCILHLQMDMLQAISWAPMLACGAAQPSCQHPQYAAAVKLLLCPLQEMPAIRFRAAKPPDMDADDSPVLEARALVPQRLAIELDAQLQGMQAAGLLPPGAWR